jgi:hypothetical protein
MSVEIAGQRFDRDAFPQVKGRIWWQADEFPGAAGGSCGGKILAAVSRRCVRQSCERPFPADEVRPRSTGCCALVKRCTRVSLGALQFKSVTEARALPAYIPAAMHARPGLAGCHHRRAEQGNRHVPMLVVGIVRGLAGAGGLAQWSANRSAYSIRTWPTLSLPSACAGPAMTASWAGVSLLRASNGRPGLVGDSAA